MELNKFMSHPRHIAGTEDELPFTHYIQLNNGELIKLDKWNNHIGVIVKDSKYYIHETSKSTADHEFTHYYKLVNSLIL